MSTTNLEDQERVAEMKLEAERVRQAAQGEEAKLNAFPGVQMEHGLQKYVLIKATDASNTDKYLVRGKCSAEYHRDAAQATVMGLSQAGLVCKVTGGGRIECDPNNKTVRIYGFSYGYGLADHTISQSVIQADPTYDGYTVTWSNEGY